ncbi:MAG: DUF2470 domain-containing protein [Endozoicomonadaceae bacterium]|nr:DUF2470 domain-containing protein [Endozoicomonadaceae bacterium]
MADRREAASQARALLLSEYQGVLSTLSVSMSGYPFGSVAPYCLNADGQLVILISRIAQHTCNISQNSKVSLTIIQSDVDDIQAGSRLTWVGDAEAIEDALAAERYYRFFPQSCHYHKTHDFEFYRIKLVRARFIGGFSEIYWVDPDALLCANPFAEEVEKGVLEQMNDDDQAAVIQYCMKADEIIPEGVEVKMVGVDSEGCHLLLGERVVRIPFEAPVYTRDDLRNTLIAMASVS